MITPDYLRKGDRIGIVSPARKISESEIQSCIETLECWGLEVVHGKSLYRSHNQYAGTDAERLEDLQIMLDDESIKAILCSRGGYGTARFIDDIDFTKFFNILQKKEKNFKFVLEPKISEDVKKSLSFLMQINFLDEKEKSS